MPSLKAPPPRRQLPPDDSAADRAWMARQGERLRRVALGLTAALVTARAYWPSEVDLKKEAGSGLNWSFAVLLVTGVVLLAGLLGGRLRFRWSWTDAAVLVLIFLVDTSAGHALARRPAFNLAWEWTAVGLLYLLVRNLPRTRGESSVLAGAMIATAAAVAVYGVYQVVVELPLMRAIYLAHRAQSLRLVGIAPGTPAQVLLEQRLLGSNEPWATFALPNSLAGFLVGPLVVAVGVGWEVFRNRAGGKGRLAALALAAAPALPLVVCLLLTKSRSAYLGLLAGVAVLAWRERRRTRAKTLALIALGGLALIGALIAGGLWTGRLDRQVLTESGKSLRYRREYWVGTWQALRASPRAFWWGFGPGNFAAEYLKHKLPEASEEITDPHNLVLDVWATGGVWAVAALLLALGVGLANLLRPVSPLTDAPRDPPVPEPEPDPPPARAGWLLGCAWAGWLVVLLVGDVHLSEGDFFTRWVILGAAWIWAMLLGYPLWRCLPNAVPALALGAGVLAVVVNLLAAGGIGMSTVALGLWMLLALGLNLRHDRPCSQLHAGLGRLPAFALAACWAAAIGTFWGTVNPFWQSERAIAAAERAIKRRPPDFDGAEEAYDRAIRSDEYSARPWLGLADLEYEIWRSRGSKRDDLRWKKIPVLLLKAASAPRNTESWTLHRDRGLIARDLLDVIGPGLTPGEILSIRGNIVEASRTAMLLYPANASLHAQLAEASAEIGMIPDAVREATEALRLDRLTPHADRKLPGPLKARLEEQLTEWKKPSSTPA